MVVWLFNRDFNVSISVIILLQSNLFNTDTKGTEPIVRFTEVSVSQRSVYRECMIIGITGTKRNLAQNRSLFLTNISESK